MYVFRINLNRLRFTIKLKIILYAHLSIHDLYIGESAFNNFYFYGIRIFMYSY